MQPREDTSAEVQYDARATPWGENRHAVLGQPDSLVGKGEGVPSLTACTDFRTSDPVKESGSQTCMEELQLNLLEENRLRFPRLWVRQWFPGTPKAEATEEKQVWRDATEVKNSCFKECLLESEEMAHGMAGSIDRS